MFLHSGWGRSLVISALLSFLATGCVDTDTDTAAEKIQAAARLQASVDRYAAEKGAEAILQADALDGAPSGRAWVVVEGDVSQLPSANVGTGSWTLVSPTNASKTIPVLESRTSAEQPKMVWLSVSAGDAGWIDAASPQTQWRLVSGTNTPLPVSVRGFYLRNGTEFRVHLVPSAGTKVANSTSGSHPVGGPAVVAHVPSNHFPVGHVPVGHPHPGHFPISHPHVSHPHTSSPSVSHPHMSSSPVGHSSAGSSMGGHSSGGHSGGKK